MNLHKLADEMVAAIGGMYGDGTKYFRDGTESAHVSDVIAETSVELGKPGAPPVLEDGQEMLARTVYGTFSAPARFSVLRWAGSSAPTLIYHHGSGESDYTARVRRIAEWMDGSSGASGRSPGATGAQTVVYGPANIIACSVPYNHSLKEYLVAVRRLDRWVFLLSASVRLTEALATYLTEWGCPRVVCAGLSLGGWITNLHHTYFDTCDVYSPIFAGAALDDLFTESIYQKLLASSARDAGERFRATLNFEGDFKARGNQNVYPVMARFDRFIRFERQAGIYRPEQMTVLERGHTTGALAYRRLAGHLGRLLLPTPGSDTADESGTGDTRFGGSA